MTLPISVNTSSLEYLCAQVVMPRLHPKSYLADERYAKSIQRLVFEGVFGFCIFDGSLSDVTTVVGELQSKAKEFGRDELIFSADFEFGLPMRLDDGTNFPRAMALGKNSTEYTKLVGELIGKEMRALGIQWNFAPVCDVNSNPRNPIINIRSFGETVETVSAHAGAFIRGLQSQSIIACAKHFPGHGEPDIDSHLALPTLTSSKEELFNREIFPFQQAMAADVQSIMIAHLHVAVVDSEVVPASLSKNVITNILKGEIGYGGLVVTDALDMIAITSTYSSAQAAILAIEAGVDVVLLPEKPLEAIEALRKEAMTSPAFLGKIESVCGRLSSTRLSLKSAGAFTSPPESINIPQHAEIALEIAKKSIEILGDEEVLPLGNYSQWSGFGFVPDENLEPAIQFFQYLTQAVQTSCDVGFIDAGMSQDQLDDWIETTKESEAVVFALFVGAKAFRDTVALPDAVRSAMLALGKGKKVIVVILGSPYIADSIVADCTIQCFSDTIPSMGAAVLALREGEEFRESSIAELIGT